MTLSKLLAQNGFAHPGDTIAQIAAELPAKIAEAEAAGDVGEAKALRGLLARCDRNLRKYGSRR